MRFWFVLVSMPLSALAVANAQTSSQSPVHECDTHGCCFPGSLDEQCAAIEFEKERRRTLQEDLQRRADEMRKELERCIADEIRRVDGALNARQRCADKAGIKLLDVLPDRWKVNQK